MPSQYSSGKNAIAECDRCGFRYMLKKLKSLVIKTKNVNILVCPSCWEPDQPQLSLGLYPVNDPQAVRNPRPDTSYYSPSTGGDGGSRVIEWGWNPVGGASGFTSALTPNALISRTQVNTVVVETTSGPPEPPVPPAPTVFSLTTPAMTSVGIYNSSGNLVRTLWGGVYKPAGIVPVTWDGLGDYDTVLPPGNYYAKMLSHNVQHTWEGMIGNTSTLTPTAQLHKAFLCMHDMAFTPAGKAVYVVGYNEQQYGIHTFNTSNIQSPTYIGKVDPRRVYAHVATDGVRYYVANIGIYVTDPASYFYSPETYVIAYNVSDNSQYAFPTGTNIPNQQFPWVTDYYGVGDYQVQTTPGPSTNGSLYWLDQPTGIAVQQTGTYLFISHKGSNQIRVLNKVTGALVTTISVVGPEQIAINPDDSFWVISDSGTTRSVIKYVQITGVWTPTTTVTGMEPSAIAVSPVNGTLLIAASTTHQLMGYNSAGTYLWTYGVSGGYTIGPPDVATNRFFLPTPNLISGSNNAEYPTYLAFQADGSFWVSDPINQRNLHYDADRNYINQIAYIQNNYVATVDTSNPNRVFAKLLEFYVDYSLPINSSWTLVRNWGAGNVYSPYDNNWIDGVRNVTTFPNGRTYAAVFYNASVNDALVELTSSGLRDTGQRLGENERLCSDYTLRTQDTANLAPPNVLVDIKERTFIGTDGSGNPIWSSVTSTTNVATSDAKDPYYHAYESVPRIHGANDPTYPVTSSGNRIIFNPSDTRETVGFHLGAIRPGSSQWHWRASKAGAWQLDSNQRIINANGDYDVTHGGNYLASIAMAVDEQIIFGYFGEGWNGGQACQFLHFHDTGLFIGQFGIPLYVWESVNVGYAPYGAAGNAFSPVMAKYGANIYMWTNDESAFGGVQRWKLEGLNTIDVQTIEFPPGSLTIP